MLVLAILFPNSARPLLFGAIHELTGPILYEKNYNTRKILLLIWYVYVIYLPSLWWITVARDPVMRLVSYMADAPSVIALVWLGGKRIGAGLVPMDVPGGMKVFLVESNTPIAGCGMVELARNA